MSTSVGKGGKDDAHGGGGYSQRGEGCKHAVFLVGEPTVLAGTSQGVVVERGGWWVVADMQTVPRGGHARPLRPRMGPAQVAGEAA